MGAVDDEQSVATVEGEEESLVFLLKDGTAASESSSISEAPSGFGYNYGRRPYRDTGCSRAFVVFLVANLGVAVVAWFNRNHDYGREGSATYDRSKGCTVPAADSSSDSSFLSFLYEIFVSWTGDFYMYVASLFLMGPVVAVALLWILRKHAKELVYATLPVFVLATPPIVIAVVVAYYPPTPMYMTLASGLFLYALSLRSLYQYWSRHELAVRIIKTAAEALHQTLAGLLPVFLAVNVAYLILFHTVVFSQMVATMNGKLVPTPAVVRDPDLICGGDYGGRCCEWESEAWVSAYSVATFVAIFLGSAVFAEVHVFTISGTISQWYFSTAESSRVSTRRSLMNALGPSFGTVCFSGLVPPCIVGIVRRAIDKGSQSSLVARVVRACKAGHPRWEVSSLNFFTRIFAPIRGESYCASAGLTHELLQRNSLSTLPVEPLTQLLLSQAIFAVAPVCGVLVWGALALFVQDGKQLGGHAVAASLFLFVFLAYCAHILTIVVNTLYICFAMDKDHNKVSRPHVHDVFDLLPPPAAADDSRSSCYC